MKKRWTALLLALVLTFSLTACGGGSGGSGGTGGGGSSAPTDPPAAPASQQPAPDPADTPAADPGSPATPEPAATPASTPEPAPTAAPTPEPAPTAAPAPEPTVQVPADPVLVSEPIQGNPLAISITSDSVYIQDLYEYMGAAMTVTIPEADAWSKDVVYYSFSGSEGNLKDIEEFISTICSGDYNLELVDKTVLDYSSTFGSYAINYTGTGWINTTQEASFSDIECNISLYYKVERGKLSGALIIPSSMEVVDLGLRRGGNNLSLDLGGPSAKEALYRMPDGSFQTGDGRLSVQPGTAAILRDGTLYTTDAEFDRGDTEDHVWARNFYRDETIFFSTPVSRLMTGDIFVLRDLYYHLSVDFENADQFDDYRHSEPFLGIGHNGSFLSPRTEGANPFEDITVRVMYWEPNEIAVYYFYVKMATAPYEVEALVAPSLKKTEGYSGGDDERALSVGQSIELSPAREYQPHFETFTWELVDGAGVVELSNTTLAACTVKATRAGTAVVRVTYKYSVDEPDVLTGYLRSVEHSRTTDYTIFVS